MNGILAVRSVIFPFTKKLLIKKIIIFFEKISNL